MVIMVSNVQHTLNITGYAAKTKQQTVTFAAKAFRPGVVAVLIYKEPNAIIRVNGTLLL